jgi:hypothetical protein
MTLEEKLNNLLIYIRDNPKVLEKDIKNNPGFSGYELTKLIRQLIKDKYIVKHWKAGRKVDAWLTATTKGELFINSGGYLRLNLSNNLPAQIPIYAAKNNPQNPLSEKGWKLFMWITKHIWELIIAIMAAGIVAFLGWN